MVDVAVRIGNQAPEAFRELFTVVCLKRSQDFKSKTNCGALKSVKAAVSSTIL